MNGEKEQYMRAKWLITGLTVLGLGACGGQSASNESSSTATNTTPTASSDAPAPSALPATAELRIYNWSEYVDPATVKSFEANHHIKVVYDYYESNEGLEAKVLTGKSGYDLVAPSNAFVGRQIKAGAYQKIDKSHIPNYSNIDPTLLKFLSEVDPGNEYAVPYFWGINTLAINKDKVESLLGGKLPDNQWDLLFNPEYTRKLKSCGITLLDSASEVFPMVLNYMGKNPNSSDPEDLKAAKDALMKVRPDVKRFNSVGYMDDLARGDICVVLGYGGDLNIAARRAKEAKNGVNIEVLVPKEGFGVWVDSWMIPKDAGNIANAYQYINATLDPQIAAKNGDFVTFAPASKPAKELMQKEYTDNLAVFPTEASLQNSFMMNPIKPESLKLAIRLWQDIKKGN